MRIVAILDLKASRVTNREPHPIGFETRVLVIPAPRLRVLSTLTAEYRVQITF